MEVVADEKDGKKVATFLWNSQKQFRGQREQTMSTCLMIAILSRRCCRDDLSYGLNTLGPLCLWQCLYEGFTEGLFCSLAFLDCSISYSLSLELFLNHTFL